MREHCSQTPFVCGLLLGWQVIRNGSWARRLLEYLLLKILRVSGIKIDPSLPSCAHSAKWFHIRHYSGRSKKRFCLNSRRWSWPTRGAIGLLSISHYSCYFTVVLWSHEGTRNMQGKFSFRYVNHPIFSLYSIFLSSWTDDLIRLASRIRRV